MISDLIKSMVLSLIFHQKFEKKVKASEKIKDPFGQKYVKILNNTSFDSSRRVESNGTKFMTFIPHLPYDGAKYSICQN